MSKAIALHQLAEVKRIGESRLEFREVRCKKKASREHPRKPRDGQNAFGNDCRNAANAAKNFLASAGMLQMPRKTFWSLQECCKCSEKLFGLCRNAASASKNFLAFAGMLQMPRKTFWSLQGRCKCSEKLSGVCNTVVSISKSTLAATAFYRKHPIGIRKSIPSSNIRS